MPDINLNAYYNFLGQRIRFGGVYSDFWVAGTLFGLPYRSIVYEAGYIPLMFDPIKYIREHNTDNPGELPTENKYYFFYASPETQSQIGSDPVFSICYEKVPGTNLFEIGYKFRYYQYGYDWGQWIPSDPYEYHYFDDGYRGFDPENVTGADHWRQGIYFVYISNIAGYGIPADARDRFGFVLQHYKGSSEYQGAPFVYDGYTFPAYNEYGVPEPELDDSYPGLHHNFAYGTFFSESNSGRANATFGRGIYVAFMGICEEVPEDLPGDFFDLDDDDAPALPEEGEYDPTGYDGLNDTEFSLPSKSVLTSGLFQLFIPNTAELQAFSRFLWSNDYEQSLQRYGMKPMDNIVNFGIIPFDLSAEQGTSTELELCGQPTGIYLTRATQAYKKVNLGSIYIDTNNLTGSYLDYEANFNLYLPCIGFVKLRGCEIIGKNVKIQYRIDLATGDCIAYVIVESKNVTWYSYAYTGNCMYKLPLNSADYASYYQRERQGLTSMFSAGASAIGSTLAGAMMGGGVGAVAGALLSGAQSVNSMWDAIEGLKTNQPEVQRGGAFSGALGYLGYKTPYIMVDYPKPYRKGFYDFYSYPTMRKMKLSICKGWTSVARCDLSGINATVEEKNMIRALLKDGVYIKSAS